MNLFKKYSEYDARKAALVLEGFSSGTPDRSTAQVDAAACSAADCLGCQRKGLEYHPFVKGGIYKCVAVCPGCGYTVEM